jgi:hypothetical protein
MAALPPPVGWKLMAIATPIVPRSNLHSAFHDRIAPRHIELIDATVGLSFNADKLVELRGVEFDGGRRSGCGGRREWRLARGQGIMNDGRHHGRVAMASDMHVERRGTGTQQVVVHGGDLESAFDQLEHHRIDFGLQQNEVAHHHRFPMHRFERDPTAKSQSWLDGDAVERHAEIGARDAIAVHVTRHGRFSTKSVVNLLPVDVVACAEVTNGSSKARQSMVCAFALGANEAAKIETIIQSILCIVQSSLGELIVPFLLVGTHRWNQVEMTTCSARRIMTGLHHKRVVPRAS